MFTLALHKLLLYESKKYDKSAILGQQRQQCIFAEGHQSFLTAVSNCSHKKYVKSTLQCFLLGLHGSCWSMKARKVINLQSLGKQRQQCIFADEQSFLHQTWVYYHQHNITKRLKLNGEKYTQLVWINIWQILHDCGEVIYLQSSWASSASLHEMGSPDMHQPWLHNRPPDAYTSTNYIPRFNIWMHNLLAIYSLPLIAPLGQMNNVPY